MAFTYMAFTCCCLCSGGKGRGVVTTKNVTQGQELMVSAPLGILYCPEGETPENEELGDHMLQNLQFTPQQQQLLGLLAPAGGEGGSSDTCGLPPPDLLVYDGSDTPGESETERWMGVAACTACAACEFVGVRLACSVYYKKSVVCLLLAVVDTCRLRVCW